MNKNVGNKIENFTSRPTNKGIMFLNTNKSSNRKSLFRKIVHVGI